MLRVPIDRLGPAYAHRTALRWAGLLLIGMLAFRALKRLTEARAGRRAGLILLGAGVLALIVSVPIFNHGEIAWLRTPIALGYASMLVGSGVCRPRVLYWRVFRFYGRISYSVHLLHPLKLVLLRPVFHAVTYSDELCG